MSTLQENTLKPLPRIDALDVIRGMALLGIFLMNIEFFNRPMAAMGMPFLSNKTELDIFFNQATEILVTGKFWFLFSLLFGMGFVVMQTQANLNGRPFFGVYARRLAALFVFGLLHIVFVWTGDVLHSYALAAIPLLLLPVLPSRVSIGVGICTHVLVSGFVICMGLLFLIAPSSASAPLLDVAKDMANNVSAASVVYAQGSYWEVTVQRLSDFGLMVANEPMIFVLACGYFLIGAGIMRSGVMNDVSKHRITFIKYGVISFIIGISIVLASQYFQTNQPMSGKGFMFLGLNMLGAAPMGIGYLCFIAFLMSSANMAKMLKVFAPAGRMALTNYLLQSVISTTVFYGYGMGYWAQWGRFHLVLFVFAVFAAQVLFSHLWLAYFRYGPMEWLWRAITYWEFPKMKKIRALETSA